jgi:DNA-binding NarL/FixJ family response regulator
MIRVVIADDQGLVRVGLRKVLEVEPDIEVMGEASDGRQAVAAAARLRPDVMLMDIRMPSLDGIEATRRIVRSHPEVRVLMLTTFGLDSYVYESLRAGASGFMLKDAPPEEIASAVRIIANGDALLAPAVTRSVIEEFARNPSPAPDHLPVAVTSLTPREREVLDLLIAGLSTPRSATALSSPTRPPRRTSPASCRNSASETESKSRSTPTRVGSSGPGEPLRFRTTDLIRSDPEWRMENARTAREIHP